MSTIIEQDGIRIVADTERAALRELKKAQKKAQADCEQFKRNEAQAELLAMSRGFHVMARLMELQKIPGGWGLYRNISSVMVTSVRHGVYSLSVRDTHGTAEREVSCDIVAVLENGAGEPMVVWFNESVGECPRPYCIAVFDNAVGLVPMPSQPIQPEMFAKTARADGSVLV